MSIEECRRHESCLLAVLIILGPAHLHETVVFAHIHTGKVHNHFLADAMVKEKIIGVDREGQCSRLILNHNAFEYIS